MIIQLKDDNTAKELNVSRQCVSLCGTMMINSIGRDGKLRKRPTMQKELTRGKQWINLLSVYQVKSMMHPEFQQVDDRSRPLQGF